MKPSELKALVEQGKKPLVRLTGNLWDESFGSKGMIARILSATEQSHDDLVEFDFDYNEHREHNMALDAPNWYLNPGTKEKLGREKGNAVEANHFDDPNNIHEEVVFDPKDDVAVELAETGPLAEYATSGSKASYVEWLELQLNSARNQVDRLEKEHEKMLREIHSR